MLIFYCGMKDGDSPCIRGGHQMCIDVEVCVLSNIIFEHRII